MLALSPTIIRDILCERGKLLENPLYHNTRKCVKAAKKTGKTPVFRKNSCISLFVFSVDADPYGRNCFDQRFTLLIISCIPVGTIPSILFGEKERLCE